MRRDFKIWSRSICKLVHCVLQVLLHIKTTYDVIITSFQATTILNYFQSMSYKINLNCVLTLNLGRNSTIYNDNPIRHTAINLGFSNVHVIYASKMLPTILSKYAAHICKKITESDYWLWISIPEIIC